MLWPSFLLLRAAVYSVLFALSEDRGRPGLPKVLALTNQVRERRSGSTELQPKYTLYQERMIAMILWNKAEKPATMIEKGMSENSLSFHQIVNRVANLKGRHGAAPERKCSNHQWLSDTVYIFVFFICGDLYVFSFSFPLPRTHLRVL